MRRTPCICVGLHIFRAEVASSTHNELSTHMRGLPCLCVGDASSLRVLGDRRPFEERLKQRRRRKAQASHVIRGKLKNFGREPMLYVSSPTYNMGNLASIHVSNRGSTLYVGAHV
ncbi:hypothetical protein PIB30_106067 [Stylosanthes scabra]|uniref:Uncharacterized protein n=1 Tax=Stylosanthes scabra TaxID=79078 RepID=A0ABU6Z0K4_9FABA|nr:hypothetical protein [Stylosanthes scabra]